MTIKPWTFLLLSWDIQSISGSSIITVRCGCTPQRGKFKALVVTGDIFSPPWILFGRTGSPTSSLIALFLLKRLKSIPTGFCGPHPLPSPWRLHGPLTLLNQTTPHDRLTDYRPNWFAASLRIPAPGTFQPPFFFLPLLLWIVPHQPVYIQFYLCITLPPGRFSIQTAVFWPVYKFNLLYVCHSRWRQISCVWYVQTKESHKTQNAYIF